MPARYGLLCMLGVRSGGRNGRPKLKRTQRASRPWTSVSMLHEEGLMRSLMDNYVYVNPFLEPMSLDALGRPDPDDSDAITYTIADPGADIDQLLAVADACRIIETFLQNLMPTDRELVERVFFLGQTQADVARHFKVSGAAISKRMTRITQKGRVALAGLRASILLQ